MARSPVVWDEDGTPHSSRFNDIYRSRGMDTAGPWAQAREVFLRGCRILPEESTASEWAGLGQWHILETGFGLGLNFLAAWDAWRQDPHRPERLFFTSVEAWPASADDLRRSVTSFDALRPLAEALAQQWIGLLPGTHRMVFEGGRLHLTLHVGHVHDRLSALDTPVDSVFLDGFSPQINPEMWDARVIKAVSRLCRPGSRASTWTVARAVRDQLTMHGFRVQRVSGLPPKRHRLEALFEPRWPVGRSWRRVDAIPHGQALVLGGGLAGSAVAWSLAQRGWQVDVLDAADHPAAGASGLPAGLIAPHVSPDDAPLSRLSRAGVRSTLLRAGELLTKGRDWAPVGVLEHRVEGKRALPTSPPDDGQFIQWMSDWSMEASASQLGGCALPQGASGLWHGCGAWIRPAQLVRAHLSHPAVRWLGGHRATRGRRHGEVWELMDDEGRVLARTPHLVLAGAYATRALLTSLTGQAATLPLHALRGQVSWGRMEEIPEEAFRWLPAWPVNGHGSFVHGVPGEDGRPIWIVGSTFERGQTVAHVTPEDHDANRVRLERLLPMLGAAMGETVRKAQGWAGVRCTLPDRMPAVGAVDPVRWPGLHVFTGLGARGLTLSVLGAELLAAQLHGEPWPVDPALARALQASRFAAGRQA